MGLCKCPKRKVTNLFCYEHDVNVCEYCLVADHERCIVQSYVQWLQDSDYNPICILCKNLLKDEPTVRLACYDVFHWSCIDKYASELPANTAPAGYQCPNCRECIFPPSNLVSPVVDALKQKLETVSWSRVGLDESLMIKLGDDKIDEANLENELINENQNQLISTTPELEPTQNVTLSQTNNQPTNNTTDDESNGFVIIDKKKQQAQQLQSPDNNDTLASANKSDKTVSTSSTSVTAKPYSISNDSTNTNKSFAVASTKPQEKQIKINSNISTHESETTSHNRANTFQSQTNNDDENNQYYDSSLGVVLNVDSLDRDTGEYKYKRRPLFEWLSRWLKSRQIANRRMFRMTRQKKILFIIVFIFISLLTLIIIFSRLGSLSTENDPALDPMNNPNIRVE